MRTIIAFPLLLLAAGCVAPPRQPAVAPTRVVAPPPPAAPIARPTDWRDWPQTPGDWSYAAGPYGSIAQFGQAGSRVFALGCDRASHRVTLTSDGAPGATATAMTILTTSLTRTLAITPVGDPPDMGNAPLAAQDPLLDAIGFSRGRFVVEQPGAEPLVLPSWPEIERVVEDCRG